jgi:hypothetical protein
LERNIEAMNGTLTCEYVKHWLIFTVTLPVACAAKRKNPVSYCKTVPIVV